MFFSVKVGAGIQKDWSRAGDGMVANKNLEQRPGGYLKNGKWLVIVLSSLGLITLIIYSLG
jgi:hypothetical protein